MTGREEPRPFPPYLCSLSSSSCTRMFSACCWRERSCSATYGLLEEGLQRQKSLCLYPVQDVGEDLASVSDCLCLEDLLHSPFLSSYGPFGDLRRLLSSCLHPSQGRPCDFGASTHHHVRRAYPSILALLLSHASRMRAYWYWAGTRASTLLQAPGRSYRSRLAASLRRAYGACASTCQSGPGRTSGVAAGASTRNGSSGRSYCCCAWAWASRSYRGFDSSNCRITFIITLTQSESYNVERDSHFGSPEPESIRL